MRAPTIESKIARDGLTPTRRGKAPAPAPTMRPYSPPRVVRRAGSDHSHIPSLAAGRRYLPGEMR